MDTYTQTALTRAEATRQKMESQMNQSSIRYVWAPLFDMIVSTFSTTIPKGVITPISEQGQPIGEVYLQTLVREGETLDAAAYDVKNGIGEITINPAPIVDALLNQYGGQGAIQVKSLFNLEASEFVDLDLNKVIFDGQEYGTAAAYLERFAVVREQARGFSFAPLIQRVLAELEASVNMALAWAKAKAEESNQGLKSGDIKRFTAAFQGRIFKFCGVAPIDEAMNQVSLNQAALANSLPQVVSEFKEAVIASRPDFSGLGEAIAEGVTKGVEKALIALQPAKEEKPQPTKGGK
jgi:hypothetical protein